MNTIASIIRKAKLESSFHIGYSTEACTKGIQAMLIDNYLLLDLEGDDLGDEKSIIKLSSLASLISSTVMYYATHKIDNNSVDKIFCLEHISSQIDSRQMDSIPLIGVLRSNLKPTIYGKHVSSDEYIQNRLKHKKLDLFNPILGYIIKDNSEFENNRSEYNNDVAELYTKIESILTTTFKPNILGSYILDIANALNTDMQLQSYGVYEQLLHNNCHSAKKKCLKCDKAEPERVRLQAINNFKKQCEIDDLEDEYVRVFIKCQQRLYREEQSAICNKEASLTLDMYIRMDHEARESRIKSFTKKCALTSVRNKYITEFIKNQQKLHDDYYEKEKLRRDVEIAHHQAQQGSAFATGALDLFGALVLISDNQLKQDITLINTLNIGGHDINIYQWSWNALANERFNLTGRSAGVIAQEIVELYPQCVNYARGYMHVNYNCVLN